MWGLLAWVAFGLMVWYGWSGFALLRAATKNRLDMLWLVGAWQVVSAIGALLVWRNALAGSLSFFGIVGLVLVLSANKLAHLFGQEGVYSNGKSK